MNVIYEPRGAAREYAPLALNLYRGCVHGCTYCYVPAVLRMTTEDFHRTATPRSDILEKLRGDIRKLPSPCPRVHLCFTCDPYPPVELERGITRKALMALRDAGVPVSVLTKAGVLAQRDLDVLATMDAEVGVTLAWTTDARRQEVEPLASSVADRLEYLRRAKDLSIQTWASVEPVINPAEGLATIDSLIPLCDTIKVGRWNHSAESKLIDWRSFAIEAKRRLDASGRRYLLKKGLAELC